MTDLDDKIQKHFERKAEEEYPSGDPEVDQDFFAESLTDDLRDAYLLGCKEGWLVGMLDSTAHLNLEYIHHAEIWKRSAEAELEKLIVPETGDE